MSKSSNLWPRMREMYAWFYNWNSEANLSHRDCRRLVHGQTGGRTNRHGEFTTGPLYFGHWYKTSISCAHIFWAELFPYMPNNIILLGHTNIARDLIYYGTTDRGYYPITCADIAGLWGWPANWITTTSLSWKTYIGYYVLRGCDSRCWVWSLCRQRLTLYGKTCLLCVWYKQ